MKKITSLSPLEQQIYFAVQKVPDGLVNYETIRELRIAKRAVLDVVLSRMCRKGWLKKIQRGLYAVSKPSEPLVVEDMFILAQRIFPGYLAFSSALYLHNLTDQVPFEVYVATEKQTRKKAIGEYTLRAISFGKRAMGMERKGEYAISTVPKTIYDCLKHPELAGGFPPILKGIYDARLKKPQWEEFLYYARRFERSAFYQRVGYLLQLLPRKNREIQKVMGLCKKKVKANVYLWPGAGKGKYIREWKLVDNIGKEALLSWWFHG